MQETIEAVYENGTLRLLKPLTWLKDHGRVTVTVRAAEEAHRISDCIGIMPAGDADEMRAIIADAFEKVDPNEWQ